MLEALLAADLAKIRSLDMEALVLPRAEYAVQRLESPETHTDGTKVRSRAHDMDASAR